MWFAHAEPVHSQRISAGDPVLAIERQKVGKRLLLTAIEHVTLELGDDQREACDLCRKVAQLDAAKVGERDVAVAFAFATSLVYLGLDLAHLLVGDDEEIARSAGRIEHPDLCHAVSQIEQFAAIVACFLQLLAQVVQEQRVQHLQDVRHAGVVHAERSALLIIGDRLDHAAEDIGVDLFPVKPADMQQIAARHTAKARNLNTARKQRAVDIGKGIGVGRDVRRLAIAIVEFAFVPRWRVHRAENVRDDFVRVGAFAIAEPLDGGGEQALSVEDVGILGEEAEDQPRHEVVHVGPTLCRGPVGVLFQKLDIELVELAGGADVKAVLANLLDGCDARKRQERAEVVREVGVGAGDGFAVDQILRLQVDAVRGEDELRLGRARLGAFTQGFQRLVDRARIARGDMDIVALEDTAGKVRGIGCPGPQLLQRVRLAPERFEKREWKLRPVKGLGGQF